jgi:N-acetylneuraminic acid mutarotase
MKKTLLIGFILNLLHLHVKAQVFTQKTDFVDTRNRAFSFAVGNKFYTGTGRDASGVMNNFMYEYNPSTDVWTQLNDFPTAPVRNCISMVINDTAYAGFGWDGTNAIGWYQYDAGNDSWTVKNSLCNAGQFSGTFTLNGKGYSVCGSGATTHNQLWEYDPVSDAWNQKANFPGAARDLVFADTANGYAFAGLGDGFFAAPFYTDIYKYDATTDTWTAITPIPNTPSGGVVQGGTFFHASYNGKIILMNLGQINTTDPDDYNSIFVYDAATDSWNFYYQANTSGLRAEGIYAQTGSKAYVGAGWFTTDFTDFWEMDLAALLTSVEENNNFINSIKFYAGNNSICVVVPEEVKERKLKASIYSADGKLMTGFDLEKTTVVSASSFAKAAYIYVVHDGNRNFKSGKLIIP